MGLFSFIADLFTGDKKSEQAPTRHTTSATSRPSSAYNHAYAGNQYFTKPATTASQTRTSAPSTTTSPTQPITDPYTNKTYHQLKASRPSSTYSHAYSNNTYSTTPAIAHRPPTRRTSPTTSAYSSTSTAYGTRPAPTASTTRPAAPSTSAYSSAGSAYGTRPAPTPATSRPAATSAYTSSAYSRPATTTTPTSAGSSSGTYWNQPVRQTPAPRQRAPMSSQFDNYSDDEPFQPRQTRRPTQFDYSDDEDDFTSKLSSLSLAKKETNGDDLASKFSKLSLAKKETNEDSLASEFSSLSLAKKETNEDSLATKFSSLSLAKKETVEDVLVSKFSSLSIAEKKETGTPVYTISVGRNRVCVFEPAREKFIETPRENFSLNDLSENEVYHTDSITRDTIGDLSVIRPETRKQYLDRASFVFENKQTYLDMILPALLLGSRVRDFEQRCATVIQMGELVLNMPAQGNKLLKNKPLKLKTISGQIFEVQVKFVTKLDAADKRWIVECDTSKIILPHKVRQGCLLEIIGSYIVQPRVTGALMNYYTGKRLHKNEKYGPSTRPGKAQSNKNEDQADSIDNWGLLSAIYGARGKRDFPQLTPADPMIRLAKNAGTVQLNNEQAEAVARYNCDSCPAFVVESPPGSGKTMTAAAMAVSYKGEGVQLFLSTANVPVINMALALAKLDYGSLTAIHLISSEREDLMTEETRSPFSVLSLAKERESLKEKIEPLEEQLKYAPNDEEKQKLKSAITKACGPVFNDTYDIYFGTVDMMLGRLYKSNQGGKHMVDSIKKQLKTSVRRVVIDEASQLTESALNALILCFPKAQIVLIGDSKQLPPFRYTPEDVVSELAARPALSVVKDKMNLPVIKLTHVYRASKALMAHYSDVFYKGELKSFKQETYKNPLSCFGSRSMGSRCLFWKVPKGVAKKHGTSKFNWGELQSLRYVVNILKNSGYDSKSVMIISYYEAQRKKAEEELEKANLKEYELLTVDSAQGREKKIVIVLTTRTSVPVDAGSFFNCALRCNVAVSRHQEALIVLGHPSIAAAPNWSRVLSPKYFRAVEDQRKEQRKEQRK